MSIYIKPSFHLNYPELKLIPFAQIKSEILQN